MSAQIAFTGLCLSTFWLIGRIISDRARLPGVQELQPQDVEWSADGEGEVAGWAPDEDADASRSKKRGREKVDEKRRPQKYRNLEERRAHRSNAPFPPLDSLPIFVESKIKMSEIFVHQGNYVRQLAQYEQIQGKKEFIRNMAAFPPANYSLSMYNFNCCAIVGSSGSLLNGTFGAVIDNYDVVLRINQAPTNRKFHRRVGSKTTLRLINTRWTNKYGDIRFIEGTKEGMGSLGERLPLEPGVTLISTRAKPRAYNAMVEFLATARKDVRNLYLSSRVVSQARRLLVGYRTRLDRVGRGPYQGGSTPSSGYLGVYMLLQLCKKVTTFGFGLDAENGTPQQYHYFHLYTDGEKKNSMNPTHSFDAERDLLRALHQHGYLTLCNYVPHDRKHNKYCGAIGPVKRQNCSLRVRVQDPSEGNFTEAGNFTRIRIPCNLTMGERHDIVRQYEEGQVIGVSNGPRSAEDAGEEEDGAPD